MSVPDIKIKLGNNVKDAASGFTGVACMIMETLNGNYMVAIQPMVKKGDTSMPDPYFIDYQMVDIVDKGVADRATTPTESPVMVGHIVKDKISGFKGTVVSKTWFLNGCVHADVISSTIVEGKPVSSVIAVERLDIQGEPKKEVPKTRTGGPSLKAPRRG